MNPISYLRKRIRLARLVYYFYLGETVLLISAALSALQGKPILDEAIVVYWCSIAAMNLWYGAKNYRIAAKRAKAVKAFAESGMLQEYALFVKKQAFIRLSVVPLMLLVGILSFFAPNNTPLPNRPLLQILSGFVFLAALIWNETAFAVINRSEYLRQKGITRAG